MQSYEDLKERPDYLEWINDETGLVPCPGGESKKQFEKRVIDGLRQIISEISQTGSNSAFVCCHGGAIACIMEYIKPYTKNFYEWQPCPGRGYTLIFDHGLKSVESLDMFTI